MNNSERLTETVERFCQYILGLPVDVLVEQVWGPKEVLAHLVYHHELYAERVAAFLAGRAPQLPRGPFRELNAAAVVTSRGIPPAELVKRLRRANRHLLALYRQHDPGEIMVVIKVGAKQRTLAALVPEVEAHIRNHHEKLRRELKARVELGQAMDRGERP